MEPEIARRCLSCGASVRGQASFCPQCGNRMGGASADEKRATAAAETRAQGGEAQTPVHKSALVEEAERVATTLNDKLPLLSEETRASGNHSNHRAVTEREPQAREDADAYDAHAAQAFVSEDEDGESVAESGDGAQTEQAETRGRIRQRAANVGASVGENLRPRVEKLREASTVVFDEATDDPGLRFVIVASVLFIIFLFIFILSYILG